MKSFNSKSNNWFSGLLVALLGLGSISAASAQIFVTNYDGNTVGEYNLDGTEVNATLLSGLSSPFGIALAGPNLFVSNHGDGTNGTIVEYNLSTGITSTFASGLSHLNGIAISGTNLFVPNFGDGTIVEYNTTSGASSTLVSGLSSPYNISIAVSGSDLFYTDYNNGKIGEYNLTTGTLNPSLVSGLTNPFGIAVSGSDLFVTNGDNTIGEYTTSGDPVNLSLVTGSSSFFGIAVSGSNLLVATGDNTILAYNTSTSTTTTLVSGLHGPNDLVVTIPAVPEPSTWVLMVGGFGLLIYSRLGTRREL